MGYFLIKNLKILRVNDKMNGPLAVDTNAVIEYRAGDPDVCRLVEGADINL